MYTSSVEVAVSGLGKGAVCAPPGKIPGTVDSQKNNMENWGRPLGALNI